MAAAPRQANLRPRIPFTREQVMRALVFLRPVIVDLREAFAAACACHDRLGHSESSAQRAALVAEQDRAIARFDRALDEIESVGAELVCCVSGEVAFTLVAGSESARLVWSPCLGGSPSSAAEIGRIENGACPQETQ